MSPCIEETVKLASRIFSVNQSTYRQHHEIVHWVMKIVSLTPIYLALSIAEDHRLCDGKGIVQVAKCVEFPFFALYSDEELFDAFQSQFITKR